MELKRSHRPLLLGRQQERCHALDHEHLCRSGCRSVSDDTAQRFPERRHTLFRQLEYELAFAEPFPPEAGFGHEEIAEYGVERAHDTALDVETRRNQLRAPGEGVATAVIGDGELHDVEREGHLVEEWRERDHVRRAAPLAHEILYSGRGQRGLLLELRREKTVITVRLEFAAEQVAADRPVFAPVRPLVHAVVEGQESRVELGSGLLGIVDLVDAGVCHGRRTLRCQPATRSSSGGSSSRCSGSRPRR